MYKIKPKIRHDMRVMGLGPSCTKWEASFEAWERYSKVLLPGEQIPYITTLYSQPLPKLEREFIHMVCEYFAEMETKYAQKCEEVYQLKTAAQRETEEVRLKFAQLVTDMKESRKRLAGRDDNQLRRIAEMCRG